MNIKKDLPLPPVSGLGIIEKLEDALDVNFNVAEININTPDDFYINLWRPYEKGEKVYYRGERINSFTRRLVPTLLRRETEFIKDKGTENIYNLNGSEVFEFYKTKKKFFEVYKTLYGEPSIEKMYDMTAFAQHYLDISPFIDFTKNLFVSVSFALKGRAKAENDLVIYTAYDIGDDDTTSDVDEVNRWLENYNVNIVNLSGQLEIKNRLVTKKIGELKQPKEIIADIKKFEDVLNGMSPTAKLIDIPTNDLMKYQQGVFLLLNNFSLVDSAYLTKAVRQSFVINKYIINSSLCSYLGKLVDEKAPQYRYECLTDISKAVK